MKLRRYKTQGKKTLFDELNSLEFLSEIGNPLEMISNVINFEIQIAKNRLTGSAIFIQISKNSFLEHSLIITAVKLVVICFQNVSLTY